MSATNALVAIDHDDQVGVLTKVMAQWAKGGSSRVTFVGVAPALSAAMTNPNVVSLAKDTEGLMLKDLKDRIDQIRNDVGAPSNVHFLSGRIADEIIKAAVLNKADFVIKVADRALGARPTLFGSVEKKLIRKCPVPVWIVRTEQDRPPARIAVAVDNTDTAPKRAEAELLAASLVKHSAELAQRFGVEEVDVVHAWSAVGVALMESVRSRMSPEQVKSYVKEWEDISARWLDGFVTAVNDRSSGYGVAFKPKLIMGDPQKAISTATKELETDLLVIGSANRSGIPGLFIGNTAESILDSVECSIFVVKPEGFASIVAPNL